MPLLLRLFQDRIGGGRLPDLICRGGSGMQVQDGVCSVPLQDRGEGNRKLTLLSIADRLCRTIRARSF